MPAHSLFGMLGRADRLWHTHDIAPHDQFHAWEAMAAQAFAPVTLARPATPGTGTAPETDAGFPTRCAVRGVGDLGVAWLASGAQRVHRSPGHVDHAPSGVYFLNLPVVGEGVAVQDGRMSVTGRGDFVLINGDRPFTLDFGARFEQVCLAIPRGLIDPLVAEPDRANCVVIKGDAGAGAIAAAAVLSLAAQRSALTARETQGITTHVLGLVALALTETVQRSSTALRPQRYQGILDVVERRLADPDLTPGEVAKELSISLSYLAKLCAEHGTSFGRLLQARRLDRAHALLGRCEPSWTVTQVATACGFHDSAYFSRAFRARFGVTPTERRATPTAAPTAAGDGTRTATSSDGARGPTSVE